MGKADWSKNRACPKAPTKGTSRTPERLFMKFDTAELHENLSIHFNINDYRNILTVTLHDGLRAVLGEEAFHYLRVRTLYHALDQHTSSENDFYLLNFKCRK
jgi:hypothetical protein